MDDKLRSILYKHFVSVIFPDGKCRIFEKIAGFDKGKSYHVLKYGSRCDCLLMRKYSVNVFGALLFHVYIRSTGILEKPSNARANMTAISISVYDIGPRKCDGFNIRYVRCHYFIWISYWRPRLFSHVECVYHVALFAFSCSVIYFY